MVTVMDREIKKRYKIMSTFESDTAYQNALKYACHTHSLRNIIMVISILSVFGAEFSLLTVMFGKNNVIITAVTIIFIFQQLQIRIFCVHQAHRPFQTFNNSPAVKSGVNPLSLSIFFTNFASNLSSDPHEPFAISKA